MAHDYGHVIIKEEIIIPDFEEPINTLEPSIFSTNSFTEEAVSKGSNSEQNSFNSIIIKNETNRPDGKISPQSSKNNKGCQIEKLSADDIAQAVNPILEKNAVNAPIINQTDLGAALKSLSKAQCSKCAEKSEVVARKARCEKCQTPLVYHCGSCLKVYKSYSDLCYHLKSKHIKTATMIKCNECGKMFSYSKSLKEHRRTVHRIFDSEQQKKSLTCKKCGKVFALSTLAVKHKKDCGKTVNYECANCSFTTNFKDQLIVHIKQNHSNLDMTCKRCKKVFKIKKSMERHLKIYCGKEKLFGCDHCGGKFYRKDEMRVHIKIQHGKVVGRRRMRSNI